jgi:hypothetical protein
MNAGALHSPRPGYELTTGSSGTHHAPRPARRKLTTAEPSTPHDTRPGEGRPSDLRAAGIPEEGVEADRRTMRPSADARTCAARCGAVRTAPRRAAHGSASTDIAGCALRIPRRQPLSPHLCSDLRALRNRYVTIPRFAAVPGLIVRCPHQPQCAGGTQPGSSRARRPQREAPSVFRYCPSSPFWQPWDRRGPSP